MTRRRTGPSTSSVRRTASSSDVDTSLHHEYAELEPQHWWFQGRRQILRSMIETYVTTSPRDELEIFDVGCGTGEIIDMLMRFGHVTAIDVAPEAVAECRARFGNAVDIRVGSFPEDTPELAHFDLVTAFDVIEHLDDDAGAMLRVWGALKPGGHVVCTAPAFEALWGVHDDVNGHRRRYRRSRLRALLSEAGFEVVL